MSLTDVEIQKARKIRALNNHCRLTFSGCSIVVTAAVAALPVKARTKIFEAARDFNAFNDDNDPHGEADMAFFEVGGEKFFFKFDYYDNGMKYHSPDPADPEVTRRVLTIGFASDY